MSDVEPLSTAAVEAYFAREAVQYFADASGRYFAMFGASADRPYDLQAWISVEGTENDVLVVRVTTKEYFPADDSPRLYADVNEWNGEFRWPKTYVRPAPSNPALVYLIAEEQYDLRSGIHAAGLDVLISNAIAAGAEFFRVMRQRHHPAPATVDVEDFERRWEEAG